MREKNMTTLNLEKTALVIIDLQKGIAGREAMVHSSGKKPLSTAVEEIYQGKVKILPDDFQEEEETTEN